MKILFLGLNYAPEPIGIGLYSGAMCRAWAAMGHDVRAIVAAPYYPAWAIPKEFRGAWKRRSEHGVDVTRCPLYVPSSPSGPKRIIHHTSFALSSFLPTIKAAALMRPDLVFTVAPSLLTAPVALAAARLCGAKCWLHIQDFEIEAAIATGLLDKGLSLKIGASFERTMLSLFDTVSTISPQMCKRLREKGVPEASIYELRNWADIEAVTPRESSSYRQEWRIQTPHVALYSGNIANKQGIEIVLQVAHLLRNRRDLTFVICGEGPHRERLEANAGALKNVQFHDLQPSERLGDLLALASVHLMPQKSSAADLVLPSKLSNMLASGRPVVATAELTTGLGAEVQDCGLVTPPGDAGALAAAIERLLDNPALTGQLALGARLRAEKRWAKKSILEHLTERMMLLVVGKKISSRRY